MELIRDNAHRRAKWTAKAYGSRWKVEVFYPAKDGPLILVSAVYSADYDTLLKVHDALPFGLLHEIPDFVYCTAAQTELRYYHSTKPSSPGQYAQAANGALDLRTTVADALGLEGATPEYIRMERGA